MIVYVKESAYKIYFWYISEDDAINMTNNYSLINKIKKFFFSLYKKMNNTSYYQRNRAKEYYENNKERLRYQVRNKYRNLSEDKNKKKEYGKNRYHNVSEKKKQKLKEYQKEYQKNYREAKKIIRYTNKINNELICRL